MLTSHSSHQSSWPVALTFAGSDSSGGAGVQADLKTFSALGVYGASVITALTAQNTQGVSAVHDIPVEHIRAQAEAVLSDLHVHAIKIGMLSVPATVEVVSEVLRSVPAVPAVLDPVMVSASGSVLLQPAAIDILKRLLFPLATVITPNLPEAAVLLDEPVALSLDAMEGQAFRLQAMGARAVLLKGGHGGGSESVDVFLDEEGRFSHLRAPRLLTPNNHGTGCTLASAIAARLAKGCDLSVAVHDAKTYLTHALEAAQHQQLGRGSGPVHHFWAVW